jgi:3-hydroxyacyl-CoA dehydrogenase
MNVTFLALVGAGLFFAGIAAFVWILYLVQIVMNEEEQNERVQAELRRAEEERRRKEDSKKHKQEFDADTLRQARQLMVDTGEE